MRSPIRSHTSKASSSMAMAASSPVQQRALPRNQGAEDDDFRQPQLPPHGESARASTDGVLVRPGPLSDRSRECVDHPRIGSRGDGDWQRERGGALRQIDWKEV